MYDSKGRTIKEEVLTKHTPMVKKLAHQLKAKLPPNIEVDDAQTFQSIDGFGYTLTGGSAEVINQLNPQKRQELLQELFGNNANSIRLSYLRISIGASDLNATPFTYDDLPSGQTDVNLDNFSLAPDKDDLIPMLNDLTFKFFIPGIFLSNNFN